MPHSHMSDATVARCGSHRDCIFMWNVFSSSGLATFLPSVALISVWLALSCITSAIHCNTEHQYSCSWQYFTIHSICRSAKFHSKYPEKAPTSLRAIARLLIPFKRPVSAFNKQKALF